MGRKIASVFGFGALIFFLMFCEQPASAADGTVRVYEATFNDFTNAIKPITVTGHYKYSITIDAGLFGEYSVTICNSDYKATVSGLTFSITPSGVTVDGNVDVDWCHLSFSSSELDASGNIFYSYADQAVRFYFYSASVQPCFPVDTPLGSRNVCLPVHINIAPTLNIPPLPIRPSVISFETASGPKQLFLKPRNVSLVKQNGYIELQSDVDIW